MLADAHRQAAEDIERAITDLGDQQAKPYLGRSVIEMYWGASFHWVAFGCQQKHGKHKENHTKPVSYLRDFGEPGVATWWDALDTRRNGGWYGHQTAAAEVQDARRLWQDIRTWALG
jgi:hypothetical protein